LIGRVPMISAAGPVGVPPQSNAPVPSSFFAISGVGGIAASTHPGVRDMKLGDGCNSISGGCISGEFAAFRRRRGGRPGWPGCWQQSGLSVVFRTPGLSRFSWYFGKPSTFMSPTAQPGVLARSRERPRLLTRAAP
jgi:hypothetical protein